MNRPGRVPPVPIAAADALPSRPDPGAETRNIIDFTVPSHAARTRWPARTLVTLGVLTCTAGLCYLVIVLVGAFGSTNPAVPSGEKRALILILAGLTLMTVGAIATRLTRRR